MSNNNRRGGGGPGGGRKTKPNKQQQHQNHQQHGSPSSLSPDSLHNWDLPSCHLLQQFAQEMWTIDKGSSETGSNNNSGNNQGGQVQQSSQQQKQKQSQFVQMMQSHLLEQHRRKVNSTTTLSSGKKKKKKKKKKAKPATVVAGQETDETDSTAALSSTVSQDSMSVSASCSKEVPKSSATAAANASSSTTTTTGTSAVLAAKERVAPAPATSTTAVVRTPVDAYLDNFLQAWDQKIKKRGDVSKTTVAPPPGRDLEAFVQYLNDTYSNTPTKETKPPSSGKGTTGKKTSSTTATGGGGDGLCIAQHELESACQAITCLACRTKAVMTLQQEFSKQPLLLPAISFGNPDDATSRNHDGSARHLNHYLSSNHNNHNGLAVPIHNPRGFNGNSNSNGESNIMPSSPSVDFDYVALEEGTSTNANAMRALMEAKAGLDGIPYFHPQQVVPAASSTAKVGPSSSSSSSTSKGTSIVGGGNQLEWKFVSSSSSSSSMSSPPDPLTSVITIQDLEHLSKNLMLPLGLPPDEFIGVCTDLTPEELQEVIYRTQKDAEACDKDIQGVQEKDLQNIFFSYEEACKYDAKAEENVEVKSPSIYLELDKNLQDALKEIIFDIVWDRLLMLLGAGAGAQLVVRPSQIWYSAVGLLSDACTKAVLDDMESLSTYEQHLAELANGQGYIQPMLTSLAHRKYFGAMVQKRTQIIMSLIGTIHKITETEEDAWTIEPPTAHNDANSNDRQESCLPIPVGVSGVLISSRKKWYAEQAFCRKLRERENQEEKTVGPIKWVQTIDARSEDLLKGLLDLAKRVEKGRIHEIHEEISCRCQKLEGMITNIGQEFFAPLTDKDVDRPSESFKITDESIRAQCHSLWAKIQEYKNHQDRQQLLEDGPTIEEQKRTVGSMARDSMRMLRILRKCVTDTNELSPPLMPLELVSQFATPLPSYHPHPRVVSSSYVSLVSVTSAMRCGRQHCLGNGGAPRFSSLILALFYRKLSKLCSEWHAELAEQELLTAMSSNDVGLDVANGSAKGDNNASGMNSGAEQAGKSGKKAKKKRVKKAAALAEAASDIERDTKQREVDEKATRNGSQPSTKPTTGAPNNAASTSDSMNGHHEGPITTGKERNPKSKKSVEPSTNTSSAIVANGTEVDALSAAQASDKEAAAIAEKMSTYHVDEKMGVADKSGTIQTAESYLVGRLTTLLSPAQGQQRTGKRKAKAVAPVVII